MAKKISARYLIVTALMWSAGCGRGGRSNPATARVEVTQQALTGAYCTGLTADFCDDFQDGNATSPAWTVRDQAVASDFTVIKDGDYVYRQGNAGTSNTRRISTAGSSWTKVMVEAKVKILSFNNNTANWVGLYARYSTSANTGYIFALGGDGKVSLLKKATGAAGTCINATYPAGGCAQTVSPAIALNTWYTLKFVLNGSLLTGYLNGTRVIETTDTTYTTGVIGVGSTGGSTFEADEIAVNRSAGACDAGFGVPKAAGTVCRAAVAGGCDKAETCDGTSLVCPTDAFQPNTTVCRVANGLCDKAEYCTGTSTACPADTYQPSTTVCRAAAPGSCDKAEYCSGTSTGCPADTFQPSGWVCRAAAGTCDVAEKCNGTSAACPTDSFVSNTTVCRVSAGVCDVAEKCTGSSAGCPIDTFVSNTTVCRTSAGICDVAEKCTGTSADCPKDTFVSNTTVCRAATGLCDATENCTGNSAACPKDLLLPAGTECRHSAGDCDPAELCSGTTAGCPDDSLKPAGTVCRPKAGDCDVAEICSGGSAACPKDQFVSAGTECRQSAGDCDMAETCTGTTAACPDDLLKPNGSVCRQSAGDCDAAETCSGSSATCPKDLLKPNTTVCRPSTGVCDVAENCTGNSALCPDDGQPPEIDRVLGMETPITDWALLSNQSGPLGSSTTASQGTHSLSIQAHGWVPIQSRPLSSLGSRVGTALQFDMQFQGTQSNPYWWGAMTIGADIPSLGVQASQNGLIANSFDLTGKLSNGWTTLSFNISPELQALLSGSYSDLQFTITLNVPSDLTGTYLIDNLRFLGGTSPTPAPPIPPRPVDLVAKADDGIVRLTWTASAGATGYKIERSGLEGGAVQFTTTDPSYTDSSVANDTSYFYTVAAIGACGESATAVTVCTTPPPATKITLYFPKGVIRDSVVLGANGILRVNDGDKVLDTAGGPMAVSNAGSGETNLGARTSVGPVTSVASVLLRSRGSIVGEVQTGGTFTKQDGAQTSGTPHEYVTLTPAEEFSWSVRISARNQGPVPLEPGDDRSIAPDGYTDVRVKTGANLRLKAGSYYFTSLDLEPGSQLHLDKTTGPIMVYVTGAVVLRGGLVDEGGAEGDFLLVPLGTQDVFVEQAFTGTIVAPNAKLSLATLTTPYRGTFFARDIESHQNNLIEALPFGWDEDCVQFGCLAPDMCHLPGVCNPETRRCSNPPKADPSAICDDGNSCTLDHCDPRQGCVHTPKSADGCSLSVQPKLTCIAIRDNGSVIAVFGYDNPNTASINIPQGNDNNTSGPVDSIYPYLPEWFQPGTVSGAMAVQYGMLQQEVTWSLKGVTARANANSMPCVGYDEATGTVTLRGGGTFVANPLKAYQSGYASSIVPSETSGALRGGFAVTDDGAATYRLPLWVPPGLMGVQPQLALSYSSAGGDGFLGRGWQLQGMSQILRCRQDFARDKKRQSIQWNDDDRLCLDGQRLVLTKGTYNAAGAEYRTEHDRHLKIVQVGKDNLGPTGFVVYQPDGMRHSYGYDPSPTSAAGDFYGEVTAMLDGSAATISVMDGTTAEPTVHYDTDVRYGWALASSQDRYDNRVQYDYVQERGATDSNDWLDFRPARIQYTFSRLYEANREIDFEYTSQDGADARVDTRFSFVSGFQLRLGHLITKIKMYGGIREMGAPVKYYNMQYEPQAPRTSALLHSVQECDGSGVCTQPTVFSWSTNDETYERIPTGKHADHNTPGGYLTPGMLRLGDFNGDGRDDLVTGRMYWVDHVPRAFLEYSYSLANPSGSQPPFWGGGLLGNWLGPLIDLNGDGTTDFFTSDINGNPDCAYFCKAGTCTKSSTSCGNDYAWGVPYVGDLDGDGLPDLIAAFKPPGDRDYHYGYMANSTSGFANQYVRFNESLALTNLANAYVSDLDGSGKAQFLFSETSLKAPNGKPSTFMRIMSDPTSYSVTSSLKNSVRTPGSMRYQFADLNGDGLPDAIEIPNAGGDVRIAINTGRGFLPPKAANLSGDSMFGQSLALADSADWYIDPGVRIVDVNLDGRADILYLGGGCRGVTSGHPSPDAARDKIITLAADNDRNGSVSLVPAVSPYNRGEGTVVGPPGSTVCVGYDGSQVLDVNGDGLADFIQSELAQNGDLVLYQRHSQAPPGLLTNVKDGYGATVDVTYAPMSDSTVYTRIECSYPQVCNQKGRWLVASHTFEKGTLTERPVTHSYRGARTDLAGIGWLGMDEHKVIDGSITTTIEYDLAPSQNDQFVKTYPKIGRPVQKGEVFTNLTPPAQALTRTSTFSLGFHGVGHVDEQGYTWWRVVYDSDGVTTEEVQDTKPYGSPIAIPRTIRRGSESRTYDPDFGYVRTRIGSKWGEGDGSTTSPEQESWTSNYYVDDPENWLGGRLKKEFVGSVVEGVTGTRVTSYERDLSTNALLSTTIEPDSGDPNLYKKTKLTRNSVGQVVQSDEYVLDPTTLAPTKARSTQVLAYDPVSGIFPASTRNALGQVTNQIYHPSLGVLVSETDANGIETRRSYDGFGRLRSESTPGGTLKQVDYYIADATKPVSTATHSVVVTQDGVVSRSYYDSADRPVSVVKVDEKGTPYQTLVQYDKYGREASKWRPYPSSQKGTEQNLPHLSSAYDGVGRPTQQQFASGSPPALSSQKSWSYDGCETRAVESGLGLGPDKTTSTGTNGAGRVVSAGETVTAKGAGGTNETKAVTTQFFYRPFGQLGRVRDDKNNDTVMTYDVRGRRRSVTDGDTGMTTSDYDAFDQLTKETYQDTNWVSRSYDALGRMTSETNKAGGTNTTIWDASANGIGKLSARTSMDGVTTEFDYDDVGRPSGEAWRIGADAYRVDYSHDGYGRLAGIAYPEVAGRRRAVYYGYDPTTGEQSSASLGDSLGPEQTLWT
ncbi:MAG TPA: FG-GAP-like repeat-containing protein, partial [Polyangia bacterium]|nr:FG-GAP-like repeat-containing protein [Polyangia bacterium]